MCLEPIKKEKWIFTEQNKMYENVSGLAGYETFKDVQKKSDLSLMQLREDSQFFSIQGQ